MRRASTTSKSKSTTGTAESHVYVYCAVRGVLPSRSLTKLAGMPGGGPLRVLSLTDRVSLIVSDVPADAYSTGAIESRLGDLDWVTKIGTAHHAVADALVEKHTVIPFRLFTLFSSDTTAVSTLGRRAPAIESALERVTGKAEWVLKVSKPPSTSTSTSTSTRTRTQHPAPAPGTRGTSFLRRKAAARHAAAETAKRIRGNAAATYDALADMAADATMRDIDAGAALLLDASFLVPSRQVTAFKRTLSKAAQGLLDAGCRVSVTGPWPPYSFVSLERDRTGRG